MRCWLALSLVFLVELAVPGAAGDAGAATNQTRPEASLQCSTTTASEVDPGRSRVVVLERVALPAVALQANRFRDNAPSARFFSKTGLLVRPGAKFDLIVPKGLRTKLMISWGGSGRTFVLHAPPCGPGGERDQFDSYDMWDVYAGGFYVREPTCAALKVKAGGITQRVPVGIGAPCPGQFPPAPGVG